MVFSKKRKANSISYHPDALLTDETIDHYKSILSNLKKQDFSLKKEIDEIRGSLSVEEQKNLNLSKLLYCTGHRKEMFLYLGIIIESKLNSVGNAYKNNRWQTPKLFINENTQNAILGKFIASAIAGKADNISSYDLFNNTDTSDKIKHKLHSFRFLRNYGGHSSSVSDFLDTVITSQPECDDEIKDGFQIMRQIKIAHEILLNNPPPLLP
jgi:hypothetical protein